MRILVTGGAGYVGSFCTEALCSDGHETVVYDNLSTGHREAVDPVAMLVVGDLGDAGRLDATLADGRFDAVLHFAASADVGESVRDPLRYYHNNVANSVALLSAMKRHGIRKLIFSSSCAVYGIPSAVPITEEMPTSPISPYGCTKLAIEWMLQDSAAAWGLGATALRYFNAAGAAPDGAMGEDHDPETHLIPRVLKVALGQAESISIFGVDYPTSDGTCIRDYVHAEDLAAVHRLALDAQPEGKYRCFNVGTGAGVSVKEVIAAARAVTGLEIPSVPKTRREADPPVLYADPTLVRTELGWEPKYADILQIVETAWAWHRSHPSGYAST